MTKPIDIEEGRRICAAATGGPWNDGGERGVTQTKHTTRDVWTIPRTVEDVTFVAHARTAYPEALDEIERLREQLDRATLEEVKLMMLRELVCTHAPDLADVIGLIHGR